MKVISNESLECLICIPQARGCQDELEEAKGGYNGCLQDVLRGYTMLSALSAS